MAEPKNTAGVVLAGGRSSRMGQDKALLNYKGRPLIEHMINVLKQAGVENVLIGGQVDGYEGIPDETPFGGPAKAMKNIMRRYPAYDGFLFVPVDMPLLEPEVLKYLLNQPKGGYYANHVFPFFIIQNKERKAMHVGGMSGVGSVKAFLSAAGIPAIALPAMFEPCMINTNTPDEWEEALRA